MSDNSSLLIIVVIVLLFGGLGYGGSLVFDQIQKQLAATAAASSTARPAGMDTGPGGIWVTGTADKTPEAQMWLRVFLNTFEIALDMLSSKLGDIAEKKLRDIEEEENKRRLNDQAENETKRKAGEADKERLASTDDNPKSRAPMDEDPESRMKKAVADEDTKRIKSSTDDPASRNSLNDDAESRAKRAGELEDAKRFSSDDPRTRAPMEDTPESKIKNAVDVEDTGRLRAATDNLGDVERSPETKIKAAAAAEDTGRIKASVDNLADVERSPETKIKSISDVQDTNRLKPSTDDFRAMDTDPETKIKGVAATEDTGRLSAATDNLADVERSPETKIKAAAANEDTGRLKASVDNLAEIERSPETKIKSISDVQDTNRLKPPTDDFRAMDTDPESKIKGATAAEDTGRLKAATDNLAEIERSPETNIKSISDAQDTKRLSTSTDNIKAAEGDPESKIRGVAAAEDTGRLKDPIDNFKAVDSDPETKIKAAVATEDTGRLKAATDNLSAVEDPESKIKAVAANEDTGRLKTATDNIGAAEGDPESKIKAATATEDTGRLKAATDNFAAAEGNPESKIKAAAAAQDSSRLTAATDNLSAVEDPESKIKGIAEVQDAKRLSTSTEFLERPADPETKIKVVADTQDSSRFSIASDNFADVERNPESSIKGIADAQDKIPRVPDDAPSMNAATESKLKSVVDKVDLKSEGKINRLKNIFKRPLTASYVSAEVVEGRVYGADGRAKPVADDPSKIKYDSKAAGALGTSPTSETLQTPKGREVFATEMSQIEIKARGKPNAAMIKAAALKAAKGAAQAAAAAADVLGTVGDVMDVLQIIQVFGNAGFYDPACDTDTTGANGCKFPTEFLTAGQAKDVSQLAVKKQIDLLSTYTPQNPDFKPKFPLIRGPLDTLNSDPYMNQTLLQLEIDAVQNRLLQGDPWLTKYTTYFGSLATVQEIANDPTDSLSYYTSKVGMTNEEIDAVYKQAFTAVCLQNKGKVWEDTYAGSGRPRLQCGHTAAGCEIARRKYFTPQGVGNYVEWYKYTDLETLLAATPRLAPPVTFTSKPTDEDGICMVSSPGTAALCSYYKGEYDAETHRCNFTSEYCQSIGTCFNTIDRTCYLPSNEMEALSFFFPGGGVREWIKVNGCTFVGTDAQKAAYAGQAVINTFAPVTLLFTPGGRKIIQDVLANSRNWGPGLKAQLSDPMIAISFAGAVVGLAVTIAVAAGLASTVVLLPVAAAIMIAVGITMAFTMTEAQAAKDEAPVVDKEDLAIHGLQKVTVTAENAAQNGGTAGTYYVPISRGVAPGWVTRKLPIGKDAAGNFCTAVQNYRDPNACKIIGSTAEIPGVFKVPFAERWTTAVYSGDPNTVSSRGGTSGTNANAEGYKFDHKIQCWKYDYTWKNLITNETTTDAAFGTTTGKKFGDAYGTPDARTGKIFDGYIRAGTDGASKNTYCMKRVPDTSLFDATIGTPATETEFLKNRTWTSKLGDTDIYFPEYPREAAYLIPTIHNHFRYQLVYAKDSIPVTTMWDNGIMAAVFTETTITEIRRYYCEQELIKYASDTSKIDKRCFGYLALGIPNYKWFAMSLPGKIQSTFNTTTGQITMGTPTQDNRSNKCAVKYGLNYEEETSMCYINCNYGSGATNDSYGNISRTWKSDGSLMCYKQYQTWEDNGQGHGEVTITKKILTAQYQGAPNDCPSNKVRGGGFCYKKCSDVITLGANEEALDDGSTQCYKHYLWWENEASRKGRPAGTGPRTYSTMNKPQIFAAVRKGLKTSGVCRDGYENVSGICYSKCAADQTGVGPTCYNKYCADDEVERTAGMCTKKCNSTSQIPSYPSTSQQYFWDESACYKNCNPGYYRSSLGICARECGTITYTNKEGGDQKSAPMRVVTAGVCSAYDFSCPSSYDRWGVGTTTPTCYRPVNSIAKSSYWGKTGDVCVKVCRCPSGFNNAGLFCSKPGTWKTGCSSYVCC